MFTCCCGAPLSTKVSVISRSVRPRLVSTSAKTRSVEPFIARRLSAQRMPNPRRALAKVTTCHSVTAPAVGLRQ